MRKFGKLLVTLAVAFALFIPFGKADAATTFKDVPKDFWAAEQIYQLVNADIIHGYQDGTFRPNQKITRAQAAIILTDALKLEKENLSPTTYKDIKKGYYAYDAIAAVTNKGIMNGINGKFQPNKPLTRAQMAIILTKAYKFKGNNTSTFKDVSKEHYAYDYVDALFANKVVTGYNDHTFKPNQPTTRAQFAIFLANAINNNSAMSELLKNVYANEQALQSYEFKGSMNLGLTLPESAQESPEFDVMAEMLKDIQVTISGSYQKDPMQVEANVALTLAGDVQTTINLPIVMTEDKMWIKLPQTPFAPLPEEMNGKFIEFDLKELQAIEGQPAGSMDIDLQTELALAIQNLFLDHFANDFYKEVDQQAVDIPNDISVKHVVKFELTNDSLQPFIQIFMKGFLPEMLELMQNPKYAEAMGVSVEDIKLAQDELANLSITIDDIVEEINKVLAINKFQEYVVINQDDYIAYNIVDLDLTINAENETYGFKLLMNQEKAKINEEVTFLIGIPDETEVIPYEELMEIPSEEIVEDSAAQL